MNEIKVYQCETCNQIYMTADEATNCEETHAKLTIDDLEFEYKPEHTYPSMITVNHGGHNIIYKA